MPLIAAHEIDPANGSIQVYNALDAALTCELDQTFETLPQANDRLIYDFELAMQAPAIEMSLRGFRVDPWARDLAIRNTRAKQEATERVLKTLYEAVAGEDTYNSKFPNSGKQLRDFFYLGMGLKPIETHYGGEVRQPMDREALEKLENYFYARPYVNAVLLYRDLAKTLQVLETEIDSDWRWRCSYNIAGTSTGRWSSSKSGIGTGSNFQNISDQLRRIFIADEGWKLCGIDLEQAEAREVGWFCGTVLNDWSYLDACESGDLHTFVTRMVYPDWPWNGDLKKDRKIAERRFFRHFTYRDSSKRLGHGTNYYGKPPTMAAHTKFPLQFVIDFQNRYFDAFPCIQRMHNWVARELQTKQYLVNAFGRRRDFFDRPNSDETLRGAIAYLFQSATGDRLNLGLWRTWKYMGTRIQVLSQLHDAHYFQYRLDDNENEVIEEALRYMDVPLTHRGRTFTIPAEPQVGFNWAHRYKLNEDGTLDDWNPKGLDKWRPN